MPQIAFFFQVGHFCVLWGRRDAHSSEAGPYGHLMYTCCVRHKNIKRQRLPFWAASSVSCGRLVSHIRENVTTSIRQSGRHAETNKFSNIFNERK